MTIFKRQPTAQIRAKPSTNVTPVEGLPKLTSETHLENTQQSGKPIATIPLTIPMPDPVSALMHWDSMMKRLMMLEKKKKWILVKATSKIKATPSTIPVDFRQGIILKPILSSIFGSHIKNGSVHDKRKEPEGPIPDPPLTKKHHTKMASLIPVDSF